MSEPEVQPAAEKLPTPVNTIDYIFSPQNFLTVFTPLIQNANALVEQANRAEIVDVETFNKGVDAVKICNGILARIEEARTRVTQPIGERIKWWNGEVAKITETVERAKKSFASKTLTFKQAEDKRLADEAEALRKQAEDQALADAAAAQASGDTERANALLDLAASTPKAKTGLKGRGTFTGASGGSKFVWKGEVSDLKAICAAVVSGELPESIIKEVSKSGMNKIANDRKIAGVFHGIKCEEKEDLNVR